MQKEQKQASQKNGISKKREARILHSDSKSGSQEAYDKRDGVKVRVLSGGPTSDGDKPKKVASSIGTDKKKADGTRKTSPKKKRSTDNSKTGPKKKKSPSRNSSARKTKTIEVKWWAALMVVGLLFAVLFIPPLLRKGNEETGDPVPVGDYSYGIDLSHHNSTDIIWDSLMVMTGRKSLTTRDKMAALELHPISFVFIKATEGASMKDREFRRFWSEAGVRNIQRGAYHFYRTSKSPEVQAKNFISSVETLRYSDLPPVLDIETIHKGCSKEKLNQDLSIWLEKVEAHYGRTPIIYTYESFAADYISEELLSKYPLWIAHYGVPNPGRNDWKYWQFTDKGIVYGIPGRVDMSVRKK